MKMYLRNGELIARAEATLASVPGLREAAEKAEALLHATGDTEVALAAATLYAAEVQRITMIEQAELLARHLGEIEHAVSMVKP